MEYPASPSFHQQGLNTPSLDWDRKRETEDNKKTEQEKDRDQEKACGQVCWSHFLIMHIKGKAL